MNRKCICVNLDKEEYLNFLDFDKDIFADSPAEKTLEYFMATEWYGDKIAILFEKSKSNYFSSEDDAYKYVTDSYAERLTLKSVPEYNYIVNLSKKEYYFKSALPVGKDDTFISPLFFIMSECGTNAFDNNKLSEKEKDDVGRWFGDNVAVTNNPSLCSGFTLYASPYIKESNSSNALSGLNIVVTGTASGFTRHEMEMLVVQHGGKCQKTVNKNTDFLVKAYKPGASKLAKAAQYGTKVISEEEFFEMIGE